MGEKRSTEAQEMERVRRAFGRRLAAAREMAGYATAEDFAAALRLDGGRYRRWEAGNREPKYYLLIRIADALNVSTDFLLKGTAPARGFSARDAAE